MKNGVKQPTQNRRQDNLSYFRNLRFSSNEDLYNVGGYGDVEPTIYGRQPFHQ